MAFNLFTWWEGMTFGTWLTTTFSGTEVGRDGDGNIYYRRQGQPGPVGSERRWVVYNGANDSSRVPPEWHLWLHHSRAEPPTDVPLPVKAWERPWRPNPTGTIAAERPRGALARGGIRAPAAADYRPWTPDQAG